METRKVYTKPRKWQLVIPGQLLRIEINYSSFTVFFQFEEGGDFTYQHRVFENIYPLSELKRFFRVNGKEDGNIYCKRATRADQPEPWLMTK